MEQGEGRRFYAGHLRCPGPVALLCKACIFTHFSDKICWLVFTWAVKKSEVECLIKLFNKLVAESSSRFAAAGFDRNMFRDILHSAFGMTDDMIMDRGETGGSKKGGRF